jgi:hypothetical protein
MVYLAGSSLVALLIATFLVRVIVQEQDSILHRTNNYLICHTILQLFAKDSSFIARGQGRMVSAENNRFVFSLPHETVSWLHHNGRIMRKVVHTGEKPVISSLASKNASFSVRYDYNGGALVGAWIKVVICQAMLQRYVCLRSKKCNFLS